MRFAEDPIATPVVFSLDCFSLLVVIVEEAALYETLGDRWPEDSGIAPSEGV